VAQLAGPGGPRADYVSRLKGRLLPVFMTLLADATRRGRRAAQPGTEREPRASMAAAALLAVATSLLAHSRIPLRRREIQERLVCAYDRLHAEHGVSFRAFCAALSLSERTVRAWRKRSATPPKSADTPPAPGRPRPDRNTRRFALDVTAPGIQIAADTTGLRILGIDLKLVAAQDVGARRARLWEAFALDTRETAALVARVVAAATAGRQGMQLVTDQGTPYVAEAARQAYDALGIEHTPQREATPTEKATIERSFATVKNALEPLLEVTNRLARRFPVLRQPRLAIDLATLLIAVYLRVYAAGRRHLVHPLAGQDPETLRAIVEEQRDKARAQDRSVRLFLQAVHDEYTMPGSLTAFVRAFRRYPLADLREAERRFRARACRCLTRICDRYFAAVVRDVHERNCRRRAGERRQRIARAAAARAEAERQRANAALERHPEHRFLDGLQILADTWLPEQRAFCLGAAPAAAWLRRAVAGLLERDPLGARDTAEALLRAWIAQNHTCSPALCDALRAVISLVFTQVQPSQSDDPTSANSLGAMLSRTPHPFPENQRPSRSSPLLF
jgi:hypothetical protein